MISIHCIKEMAKMKIEERPNEYTCGKPFEYPFGWHFCRRLEPEKQFIQHVKHHAAASGSYV